MASDLDPQELHDNVREFFPDYGSLGKSGADSKKKAAIAKALSAGTAAVVLTVALIPYVVCHPRRIGETRATISAKVMNLEDVRNANYFLYEYPGASDRELLEQIRENPRLGRPVPPDDLITFEGLQERTTYRLCFYTEGREDPETGENPGPVLLGNYSFTTGSVPVPPFLQRLRELLHPEKSPEEPEVTLAARETEAHTVPTVPETETQPTEQTLQTRPTEQTEAVRPTRPAPPPYVPPAKPKPPVKPNPPVKPTDPPAKPTDPPVKPTDPPETSTPTTPPTTPPTEPPTEPPRPAAAAGTPTANFTERSDGISVFSADFPFTLQNATATRGEFVVTHHQAGGTVVTDPPLASAPVNSTAGLVLKLVDAAAGLGETVSIQPTLYYKGSDGKEVSLAGTPYEAAPAGFDKSTRASLQYDILGDQLEYTVNLQNIVNPTTAMPAGATLTVENLVFTFLNNVGEPVGAPYIVPVNEPVSGTAYSKTGTSGSLPVEAWDAKGLQVSADAVWKVNGQPALRSSTVKTNGTLSGQVFGDVPKVTSAAPIPGTGRTAVTVTCPYYVRSVTPEKMAITVSGGSSTMPASSEGVPVMDDPEHCSYAISYEVAPGETVTFHSVLSYDEAGVKKTMPGSDLTLHPGDLSPAGGSLNCNYDPYSNAMTYQLDLSGIYNIASGDSSGLTIESIIFRFTPQDGGSSRDVYASGVVETLVGGNQFLSKNGKVYLDSIPSGTYQVTAVVSGKWNLNGAVVQDVPTRTSVICVNPVTVSNAIYTVSAPAPYTSQELTASLMAVGTQDPFGDISYAPAPADVKPGEKVYLKFAVDGQPSAACEVGNLTVESPSGLTLQLESTSQPLNKVFTGAAPDHLEYVYSFTMPYNHVSDLAITGLQVEKYVKIALAPDLYRYGTLTPAADLAYFKTPPVIGGDAVLGRDGAYFAKENASVTITVNAGIRSTAGLTMYLVDTSDGMGDIRLQSYNAANQATQNPDSTVTEASETFTFTIPVNSAGGYHYEALAISTGTGTI